MIYLCQGPGASGSNQEDFCANKRIVSLKNIFFCIIPCFAKWVMGGGPGGGRVDLFLFLATALTLQGLIQTYFLTLMDPILTPFRNLNLTQPIYILAGGSNPIPKPTGQT